MGLSAAEPGLGSDLLGRILYRDGLLLALDKPPGLPVHAGPKGGGSLSDGLGALRFGLPADPALAHRLDRDTSGCLLLGRHRKATARLGELFAAGRVAKSYLAVVTGAPPKLSGLVDAPLAKRSGDRRSWWMKVDGSGQPARTRWRVLGRGSGLCAVLFEPETGRTHQIRVHAAHLGCPLLGDRVYGTRPAPPDAPRMQLHAWSVLVPLHERKPALRVTAPVPADMADALRACGVDERELPFGQPAPAA